MLSDAEIAKLVLSDTREFVTELAGKVLAQAQELAQEHDAGSTSSGPTGDGHGGSYLSSLYVQVDVINGVPVGEVGSSSPIGLIVEFGTANRETESGAARGAMPAEHILQRAATAAGLEITAQRT